MLHLLVALLMMVACDPGGVHVGLAGFDVARTGQCVWTQELPPEDALALLHQGVASGQITDLVVERWVLFPHMAPKLSGSDMPTSQMIGAVRFLVRTFGGDQTELYFQSPTIKVPTRALARSRKLKLRSATIDHSGGHANDAELHGLHWLERHNIPWRAPGRD